MRKPVDTDADPFAPEAREAVVESSAIAPEKGRAKGRGWRRLLQVNLLMVLIALALVSGYFAMRRNLLVPYLEQKAAREELAKRGAQFSAVPASPKWAQMLFQIADDDFQNVEMIKLENIEGIRDADLIHLHKFPRLRRLYLANTRVTDEGMKHLRYCTQLRRISLWDTQVGDAGIEELETLQDLRIIDLHRTWTTDAALETLGKLQTLEELVLDDATTSRGIAHLAELKNLRRLNLKSTTLEADCLMHLADCPIEILELTNGFADRESAKNFRHVPRIRSLSLSLAGATDEDLEWLEAMQNLRTLELFELEAEGAFARRIAGLPRLGTLILNSDRLRTEHLKPLLSPPQLKVASISVAATDDDLAQLPRRPSMLSIDSPWPTRRTDSSPSESGRSIGPMLNPRDRAFLNGEATSFVDTSRRYMTAEDLAPLLAQGNLTDLALENWEFAPGALAALAQLDRLQLISLRHCRFESEELEALARLPNLLRVTLRDAPVRDAQLAAFVAAPSLEALEVHLTDADAATVLALVKNESLKFLTVSSTTLDDAFLDEVDAILAPRARAAVAEVVQKGRPTQSLPHYRFASTGISNQRAREFRDRYAIAIGVAKQPGTETPREYWGVWPAEERFGWIDPAHPTELDLSPLELDLPHLGESPERFSVSDSTRWRAAYAEFAHAFAPDNFVEGDASMQWRSASRPSPWTDWRFAPLETAGQTIQISLDRFGSSSTRQLLQSEPRFLVLAGGTVPPDCLEALSLSPAREVILGVECQYDEATLQAIARMPSVETVNFSGCRKPTPEEVAILDASKTLRTIAFQHRGEPMYFHEIARPGRPSTAAKLAAKVVYDAEDAIRERPPSLILANFEEKLWPSILADPQSIAGTGMRNDWSNQWRFHIQLEVRQRRLESRLNALQSKRDAAMEADGTTNGASPENLGDAVEATY